MSMEAIDRIILGDNQFFGINHMSQEKAQQLAEKFFDIRKIFEVYDMAFEAGIKGVMLNSHERSQEICDHFRTHPEKYKDVHWYPSVPYPHKYASLIAEKGIISTINEVLFKSNTASGVLGMLGKGGVAVVTKDVIRLMKMLIDMEMKMFRGLDIKVVFLQNIITDLLLGYNIRLIFEEYCHYIREKYKAVPGLITQNMPALLARLKEWEISEVVVCASFNSIGYLMSPDVNSYITAVENNDPMEFHLMAMSTLASGAIRPEVAYEFINAQKVQSVVFGASSRDHIRETVSLIKD